LRRGPGCQSTKSIPIEQSTARHRTAQRAEIALKGIEGKLAHDLPPAIDDALVSAGFKGTVGAPALNTVLHRLSVLSKAHQMRDLANPTKDPAVQELVRRIRRAYAARGVRPAAKHARSRALPCGSEFGVDFGVGGTAGSATEINQQSMLALTDGILVCRGQLL
jgi:hypothetical protein